MAVSGDVTLAPDAENVKVHPYVVAIVRWCVSYVWSMATVLVHRIMTNPGQHIKALKPPPLKSTPRREIHSSHIHPEPKVECVVLHQPKGDIEMDFVFVHGLYGSLENTWRQGDWLTKYKEVPEMVPLKKTNKQTNTQAEENKEHFVEVKRVNRNNNEDSSLNYDDMDDLCDSTKNIVQFERFNYENEGQSLLENEDEYNKSTNHLVELNKVYSDSNTNTSSDYYNSNDSSESYDNIDDSNIENNTFYDNTLDSDIYITETFYSERLLNDTQSQIVEDFLHNCDIDDPADNNGDSPNVEDFICDCRLRNIRCEAGCGCVCDKCYSPCWPKDWIKLDFPYARIISINYTSDPYLWRPVWIKGCKRLRLHERADQMMKQLLDLGVGTRPIIWVGHSKGGLFIKQMFTEAYDAYKEAIENKTKHKLNFDKEFDNSQTGTVENDNNLVLDDINKSIHQTFNKQDKINKLTNTNIEQNETNTKDEVNLDETISRSDLWLNSVGFMFYSVPHRGSPLADFKTPITARSIELLEMGKDCAVVLSLQQKWLVASNSSRALVTSIVETCKTLMSILWLRIVSVDSADAGIGALYGISVDHREICKPSSRSCVLYKELVGLVHNAMDRWRSQYCERQDERTRQ